jgi:general secretion pathway protein K
MGRGFRRLAITPPARPGSGRRGIALLVTLAVMTVLVATALEFNRRARTGLITAAAARDQLTLTQMAAGGAAVAMAVLAKDKTDNDTDTPLDDWANPEVLEKILQELPFEDGRLTLRITDESSRLQVNALVGFPDGREFNAGQRTLWERFLKRFTDLKGRTAALTEDEQPEAIINSLKDWMDSGDDDAITGLSGAESSYYAERRPPYPCRNGPVVEIDELLLVKGITPALLFGEGDLPGIAPYLTVHGAVPGEGTGVTYSGRINVNTAELPVLFALFPEESEELVEALDEIRRDIVSGKMKVDMHDPSWWRELPGMQAVKLDPRLVALSSDLFRIESAAVLHDAATVVTAVVQRVQAPQSGKWTCRVLSWKVD